MLSEKLEEDFEVLVVVAVVVVVVVATFVVLDSAFLPLVCFLL